MDVPHADIDFGVRAAGVGTFAGLTPSFDFKRTAWRFIIDNIVNFVILIHTYPGQSYIDVA